MPPTIPPELFVFIGVNVFVAMSLLTSIFDGSFPNPLPYIFQIAALAGFGQIWANYVFFSDFVEARFWSSMLYLSVVMISIVAVNFYIAIKKQLLSIAGFFLGAFTIPTGALSFLLVSAYVNGMAFPMPWLPIVPIESLYIVLVSCMVILGLSILAYVKPGKLEKIIGAIRKRNTSSTIEFIVHPRDDQKIINQEEVKTE
jgi:hypothetical protein